MAEIVEVNLRAQPIDRFVPLVGEEVVARLHVLAQMVRAHAQSRVVWNVSSTAVGGGVAEMLRTFLAYARGAGVDARWIVIKGSAEFFRVTKRLHNALHGSLGDGSPLGDEQHAMYEQTSSANAQELLARVRPGDVVILHDPQTAGLAASMRGAGARVIWRCHIGSDTHDAIDALGWAFLERYLADAEVCVFSREAYIPPNIPRERTTIIVPSIDPLTPKNEELSPTVVQAILAHTGLVAGEPGGDTSFTRWDGSPGRVDRGVDLIRLGPPPAQRCPLVVQVSRWDALKDPIGVLHGFARYVEKCPASEAQLVLAGPNVHAVADDPDAARIFDEVVTEYRALPHNTRRHIHLAALPTVDVEENAAIVNALQRHAAVIVQKSLHEGFGLTVTEAMWKTRPVIASAVGGIVDQVVDGESGVLLRDPRDLDAFATTVERLVDDPAERERLGKNARARVIDRFLAVRDLADYGSLIARLDLAEPSRRAA